LRIPFADKYDIYSPEVSPKSLEAVTNPVRNSQNPDGFYQKLLTECWKQAFRVLKPAGILAFTFHHSEDEPWVAVLTSLFDAGFYLEAAYPIRSDETKGEGGKPGTFGSQLIEYDIVHVCRKRLTAPMPISWARLRKQIMQEVRQLQEIIEQHEQDGLGDADLQVIRRGKALEYYSRHYGKVYVEKGREDEFTVKDALVGINQLLDDEGDLSTDRPPESAVPYTRQFLRLFADKDTIDRDQMQKHLKGTGVSPSEFVERGWCTEVKKVFILADPLAWAQDWKGKSRRTMARDFDQAYFLIGASYENSGIKVSDTLNSDTFIPHPALGEILTWFVKHSPTEEMRSAAKRAQQLYTAWQAKNTKVAVIQRTLFDLEE
jgi:adenine-specific DNA methylase